MTVTVRVPSPLRKLTGGAAQVAIDAGDVRSAIAALEAAHPGFADRLLDDRGEIRRFVNLFVRDEDVRFLGGLDATLEDGDVLSIVPAVAGGAPTASNGHPLHAGRGGTMPRHAGIGAGSGGDVGRTV